MRSYDETMEVLEDMKSRYKDGFSSSDRQVLDSLHQLLFGHGVANKRCSDCFRDAYIVIYNKLKQDKVMPVQPNYVLKAGAIIHPAGTSKFYTNPLSDEVAEEFISKFPNELNKFSQLPTDWEERVEAYKAKKEQEAAAKASTAETSDESLNTELATATAKIEEQASEIESLKAELAKVTASNEELLAAKSSEGTEDGESEELNELKMELETAKTELESAQAEIASLKATNTALKAANTKLKNGTKESE